MKGFVVSLVAVGLLVACGGGSAATQPTPSPPGPLMKYTHTLAGLNASGIIDLIQNVIDFGPGAASVVHTHPTPNLATVLQGQITVKVAPDNKQADAGGMLVEPINQPVQAVNTGSGEAMVVVAFAVPRGSKATAPVAGRPAPALLNKTLYTFTLAAPGIYGPYSLVQEVLDFAPGSQTSIQRYGGPGLITVLQGHVVLRSGGSETTYGAGETFAATPIDSVQLINRDSSHVVLAATFMLPDGAQLTTKA